jgi:hypothetical protein
LFLLDGGVAEPFDEDEGPWPIRCWPENDLTVGWVDAHFDAVSVLSLSGCFPYVSELEASGCFSREVLFCVDTFGAIVLGTGASDAHLEA